MEKKNSHGFLNALSDPVFVKNKNSKLVFVNDAFCTLFGLQKSEIIGKTLAENVAPEERESFLKIDREVIETGEENISEETLTLGDSPTKHIATKKSLYIGENEEKFLLGIIRDITDRVKAEQEVNRKKEELRLLNSKKDKLFSIIAHDLKTPFANITGLSNLITENINSFNAKDILKHIDLISKTVHNSSMLLENLLNWAKTQTGQLSPDIKMVKFSELLEEVTEFYQQSLALKGIDLDLKVEANLVFNTDRNMVNLILRNIIGNAIKYSKPKSKISINAHSNDEMIHFMVEDKGIGINEVLIEKIMASEVNHSTLGTLNETGSGLGIVLCREFISALKGSLELQSQVNNGTVVKVSLPLEG